MTLCAFICAGYALHVRYACRLRVNIGDLVISQTLNLHSIKAVDYSAFEIILDF